MATTTTNLGLTKPAVSDAADISVLNANFDKIDEKCNPALFAPAGYGLGMNRGRWVDITALSDLDALKAIGWYSVHTASGALSIEGITFSALMLEVSILSDGFAWQTVRMITDNNILRRKYSAGTWQPWEWVLPSMYPGVEYRTTERWQGKAVYTKLVDFGALPNTAAKGVYAGVSGATGVIGYEGVTANAGNDTFCDMSMFPAITGSYADLVDGNINIVLTTDRDATHLTAKIKIRYVKS